jgi:glycosyltransferase involved in cell wall biosynthesis/predicted metal-dependent phosphoesterase TrpH
MKGQGMQSKADLHVHSKYSDRPSEWLLRRIGAPECFVEPEALYQRAVKQGMSYVTITDHNSISGALEIAHHPNTFLSAEITTYFPEDRCKIHILVHGITEADFRDIDGVRESIYDLRDLLLERQIVHTVAHPLFSVNDRLTLEHVEKLLLNGTRQHAANRLFEVLVESLTPDIMAQLANTYDIEPVSSTPWLKMATGGSDDHSGAYAASAHTVTPYAGSVEDFLTHLHGGRHEPGGRSGTSLRMAHSFYQIAYSYYRNRLLRNGKGSALLSALLERLAGAPQAAAKPQDGLFRRLAKRVVIPWKQRKLTEVERGLVAQFSELVGAGTEDDGGRAGVLKGTDAETFELAARISHQVGYHFLNNFLSHVRDMSFLESLQNLASLAPVGFSIAPYVAAFCTQHKDDDLLRRTAARYDLGDRVYGPGKRAWVTDTFGDVNGVAKTIRTLASLARTEGKDLTVVTCLPDAPGDATLKLRNFQPVGMFELPEYAHQQLAFPPFLEVIEYLEREQFTELIISTPGPLGVTALAASKLLGIRTKGIYHTDFPKYVEILTEDEYMAQVTWRFMVWFYSQMDCIFAPSEWYRGHLRENGLAHKQIEVLPRGVDPKSFSPDKRDPAHWGRFGANGHTKFLYVGRISREKNVEHLVESFDRLRALGHDAELVLVGDGPLMGDLRKRCRGRDDIIMTGYLHGEDLSRTYASADVFVFPSSTDTFGNVVLEAQASGLPAIVSDQGGPPEIVRRHGSGIVVDMNSADALTDAMARLYSDADLRSQLAGKALENARESTWSSILDAFWHCPVQELSQSAGTGR